MVEPIVLLLWGVALGMAEPTVLLLLRVICVTSRTSLAEPTVLQLCMAYMVIGPLPTAVVMLLPTVAASAVRSRPTTWWWVVVPLVLHTLPLEPIHSLLLLRPRPGSCGRCLLKQLLVVLLPLSCIARQLILQSRSTSMRSFDLRVAHPRLVNIDGGIVFPLVFSRRRGLTEDLLLGVRLYQHPTQKQRRRASAATTPSAGRVLTLGVQR